MALEKERLISQIEGRAFQSILPHLTKPWMELRLSDGKLTRALRIPRGMGIDKDSLRAAREREIKVAAGKEDAIPILSEKIGSLFIIMRSRPCYLKNLLKEGHRVLKREGRILIGFIPRNTSLGQVLFGPKEMRYPSLLRVAASFDKRNGTSDHAGRVFRSRNFIDPVSKARRIKGR